MAQARASDHNETGQRKRRGAPPLASLCRTLCACASALTSRTPCEAPVVGDKEMNIQGVCYEPNGIHIGGEKANRRKQTVTNFECLIPDSLAGDMKFLTADEAVYVLEKLNYVCRIVPEGEKYAVYIWEAD